MTTSHLHKETGPVGLENEEGELLFRLAFPSSPDRLKLVRAIVQASAKICGLDEKATHDLVLAVDEACQNVIRHAYRGETDGDIILVAFRSEDSIILKLLDFAPPVDVDKIKPRELSDVRPGGLGTHFIFELMDEATYVPSAEGEGNLLRMVKKITSP